MNYGTVERFLEEQKQNVLSKIAFENGFTIDAYEDEEDIGYIYEFSLFVLEYDVDIEKEYSKKSKLFSNVFNKSSIFSNDISFDDNGEFLRVLHVIESNELKNLDKLYSVLQHLKFVTESMLLKFEQENNN